MYLQDVFRIAFHVSYRHKVMIYKCTKFPGKLDQLQTSPIFSDSDHFFNKLGSLG